MTNFNPTRFQRLVIKIGSALLTDEAGKVNRRWLAGIAQDIASLRAVGQDVLVVSSGAISIGCGVLGIDRRRTRLDDLQAAAAAGQVQLVHAYQEALSAHGFAVAQVLVTLGDTENRRRYLNAKGTLAKLLAHGVIPVINENDTVATDEIRYGDNDRLAARVAQMAMADGLLLLSDVDGFYTSDPNRDKEAKHIAEVDLITDEMLAMAGGSRSRVGSGGMATKLQAARIATHAGCSTIVASGAVDRPIDALRNGARHTVFHARGTPSGARKQWLAGVLDIRGKLQLDDGAAAALAGGGSLLPVGVIGVLGSFCRGDPVTLTGADGEELGRGLVAYESDEAAKIAGCHSAEIEIRLGYPGRSAMVHRNDLILFDRNMTVQSKHHHRDPPDTSITLIMDELGRAARRASQSLANCSAAKRNAALLASASEIRSRADVILSANQQDLNRAKDKELGHAMLDRLALDAARLEAIASGLEAIAELPDPLGRVLAEWVRPNGLHIQRVSVPLGVIGMIYESRPNVTADAAGLCLKSGNPVILRGGSESFESSRAIYEGIVASLSEAGIPAAAVQMVPTTDRAAVGYMLSSMRSYIDVLVPRGGKSLIRRVQKDAGVPVIGHLEGICHVYLHESANADMATDIVLNSKMRRTGICGAAETLLVDRKAVARLMPRVIDELVKAGCEVRGDADIQRISSAVLPASEQDWTTEYLDAVISVRTVDGVDGAIEHIQTYGSGHTECIVADQQAAAESFLTGIDSAILLHNASTQFADGGEFGMGAEIGIATGKIHARGPVGAEQLTSYKYVVRGAGQVRS